MPSECPRDWENDFIHFEHRHHFQFFADPNMSQVLSQEEVTRLPGDEAYYIGVRQHMTQCAIRMLRVQTVLQKGGRVDEYSADYEHTEHCVKLFLIMIDEHIKDKKDHGASVKDNVRFLSC